MGYTNKKTKKKIVLRIRFRRRQFDVIKKLPFLSVRLLKRLFDTPLRWRLIAAVFVLLLADIYGALNPFFKDTAYALGASESLLPVSSPQMASSLSYDSSRQAFVFKPSSADSSSVLGRVNRASAVAYKDSTKGVIVDDPIHNVSFTVTPKYHLLEGRQDRDRVVYPLADGAGWLVYTMQGIGVKEDVILTRSVGDTVSLSYDLSLGNNLEAKVEKNGSVGVYGNNLFSGDIATGTEKDMNLLKRARENAPKDTLLFTIPKPVVNDEHGKAADISVHYSLHGSELTVTATGLNKGNYPLSIDPSVYIVSAEQFMLGNNETNIDFDIPNKLIKKAPTTGARFDQWNTTDNMPEQVWGASAAAAGGYIYIAGGTTPSGQIYTSQGASTYTVPMGVSSIVVETWGAGAGAGGGASGHTAGSGGAGGYVQATVPVTPGETLDVYVGGGGSGGGGSIGGGGGGYSSVFRSSTPLVVAAGGGGGGGANANPGWGTWCGGAGSNGFNGGAGGGTNGANGSGSRNGSGGTQSSGGNGGTGSTTNGANGSSLAGGAGGNSSSGSHGSGASGGNLGGANGGSATGSGFCNRGTGGGGGGGGGYYGGGGGATTNLESGGSAGGGSSYTIAGSTSVTNTAGSGTTPGNSGDPDRNGAGDGATGSTGNGGSGSNGLVKISLGGASISASLNWAKFDTGTGTIVDANPGQGPCSGWCTTGAYDLPDGRANFSFVAYNGFLYAMGGIDGSDNRESTVFVAKLGANGEPRLWHPTDTDPDNWVYWYQDSGLTNVREYTKAVAYNNRMYLIGGISTSSPVSTVQIADILPNGKLGSWSSSTSLPSALYGHDVQVYNDYLYVIGGASSVGGTPSSNVYYNKINANGTLNAWKQTTSLSAGRMNPGGNMSVVWGAYIYVNGGCTAVNGSGYCTNITNDTQVASINADGTIDQWNTVSGATSARMSQTTFAWRNTIYSVGGCSSQDTSTGSCNTMLNSILYGTVNSDGDASIINQSSANGAGTCTGGSPYDCDLPGTTYIGNLLSAVVITNGYLYVLGGCTNNACSATSNDFIYAAISSTGHLTKPDSCPSGSYQGGVWCSRQNFVLIGGAASSVTVSGGVVYIVGGFCGGGCVLDSVLHVAFNPDGSPVGSGTVQSLSSVGAQGVAYSYAFARSNPSSAGTNPGNLYILGGCTSISNANCTAYTGNVYKCNIQASGNVAGCSTSGQLQIGTIPGDSNPGLGIMSGAIYAGYVYLIGGASPGQSSLDTVRYAKINDSNNIVAVSGGSWVQSAVKMNTARSRAVSSGYNGYIYVIGGYDSGGGGGVPDIEFAKINVSTGDLISSNNLFTVSTAEINQRWGLAAPVSNSYAYVIGGCTVGASPSSCTTRTDSIQTLQIYNNDSGMPADFSTSANTFGTEPGRVGIGATVLNGYIYVAGGCTSTASYCNNTTNNVSYASIDVYGNVGTWSSTSATLPADRGWGKLKAIGNTLYYIGGQDDNPNNRNTTVYYATPSSGNITSWSTASNGLPVGRSNFGASVWNDRLYVVGGEGSGTGCSGGICSTVFVSPQLSGGGNITSPWTVSSAQFNVARSGTVSVAYANNLYLFGGYDGSDYLSDTQYAQINTSNGQVGSWSYSASLPNPLAQGDGFAANGYVYIFGGQSSSAACDPISLVGSISANTTIASGNNPTGIGKWDETNEHYDGGRFGNASLYYAGKAYVLGGANCLTGGDATYTSPGSDTYNVPDGVGGINVKMWGGGGGGGPGQSGGGAGYSTKSLSVTGGETLNVYIGGAGGAGSIGGLTGGGGGGYSGVFRGSTPLLMAGGGGGGGSGSTGGVGGGTSGGNSSGGGYGGTQSAGGNGGSGTCAGFPGAYLTGGNGGYYFFGCQGGGGGANNGGTNGGGDGGGGLNWFGTYEGGGGGGGGYYGGGGGDNSTSSGGGGGGSGYAPSGTTTAGSGTSPGNSGDGDRGGAGNGGTSQANGANGKVIVTLNPVNYTTPVIQQSTILAQPQVAKYSIMIDADTDVYPTHWLLNGIDNSIGARWKLNYRSMTNPGAAIQCASGGAMSTWGQVTYLGDISLGEPDTYTPLDGSGANTNCARYFYFNVTVDAQRSFGYPDDVTRGPTIDDMTLQFTSDPSKRLMHGRTFTGGLQMPVDTPYYNN